MSGGGSAGGEGKEEKSIAFFTGSFHSRTPFKKAEGDYAALRALFRQGRGGGKVRHDILTNQRRRLHAHLRVWNGAGTEGGGMFAAETARKRGGKAQFGRGKSMCRLQVLCSTTCGGRETGKKGYDDVVRKGSATGGAPWREKLSGSQKSLQRGGTLVQGPTQGGGGEGG